MNSMESNGVAAPVTGVTKTAAGLEASVGIEGIDAITYSTDGTQKNWDNTRRFFADWGLKPLADDAEKQVWETLNGEIGRAHV